MPIRKEVSFRRRVVGCLEVIITFPLVGFVVRKVLVATDHSAWQSLAGIAAAVSVAGAIFLIDWLCLRWLHRKSATRSEEVV